MTNATIGGRLSIFRVWADLTPEEAAPRVGLWPATLRLYEAGRAAIPAASAVALCRLYRREPAELFAEDRVCIGTTSERTWSAGCGAAPGPSSSPPGGSAVAPASPAP